MTITRLLTLIAIAIVCGPSLLFGQVVMVEQKICGLVNCRVGIGSGVVIGRTVLPTGASQYAVLTVAHNAGVMERHRWNPSGNYNISVVTPHGKYPARIVQCDGPAWLMLLIFVDTSGQQIPVMRIANSIPQAGESVTIQGYSANRQGQFGQRSLVLRSIGATNFTTTSPFEQGESGGPVLNRSGEIVGLCEGYINETKIGYGPSVIAIRRFLHLPDVGSGGQPRQGQVGTQPAVPVQSPGMSMQPGQVPMPRDVPRDVPPPPIPRETVVPAPVPQPVQQPAVPTESSPVPTEPAEPPSPTPAVPIPPVRPTPIPDPISNPITNGDTPADPRDPPATPIQISPPGIGSNQPGESVPTEKPTESKVVKAVETGLNIWSLLAGAGIVAGTGGIGGLAFAAWRGAKAVRALRDLRQGVSGSSQVTPSMQQVQQVQNQPPVAPVLPHQPPIHLPLQSANFVEVPNDYRRQSVDYALQETGRKYPGAIATIEVVKSLINQHLQATGHGPETLHP